jgi:hypothetical protein
LNMMIEERMHGDVKEHRHAGYDYWHSASRLHNESTSEELPAGHILTPDEQPEPRGLQVQPFKWTSWDEGCEAKGICQGFSSVEVNDPTTETTPCVWEGFRGEYTDGLPVIGVFDQKELHHRSIQKDLIGLAEAYWQCPHCRQLQKPIQWVQGARLETYNVKVRGNRTVIWTKVSSGQWFVLVTHGTLQGVAMGSATGTVYAVGNTPPLQLPDETAVILARRMWYRLTRGFWSNKKQEE